MEQNSQIEELTPRKQQKLNDFDFEEVRESSDNEMVPLQYNASGVRKTQTFTAKGALNTVPKSELRNDLTCQTEFQLDRDTQVKSQVDMVTDATGQYQILAVIQSEKTLLKKESSCIQIALEHRQDSFTNSKGSESSKSLVEVHSESAKILARAETYKAKMQSPIKNKFSSEDYDRPYENFNDRRPSQQKTMPEGGKPPVDDYQFIVYNGGSSINTQSQGMRQDHSGYITEQSVFTNDPDQRQDLLNQILILQPQTEIKLSDDALRSEANDLNLRDHNLQDEELKKSALKSVACIPREDVLLNQAKPYSQVSKPFKQLQRNPTLKNANFTKPPVTLKTNHLKQTKQTTKQDQLTLEPTDKIKPVILESTHKQIVEVKIQPNKKPAISSAIPKSRTPLTINNFFKSLPQDTINNAISSVNKQVARPNTHSNSRRPLFQNKQQVEAPVEELAGLVAVHQHSKTVLTTPFFKAKRNQRKLTSQRYFSQTGEEQKLEVGTSNFQKQSNLIFFYQPLEQSLERQLERILLKRLQDKPISRLKTDFMSIPKLYDSSNNCQFGLQGGETGYLSGLKQVAQQAVTMALSPKIEKRQMPFQRAKFYQLDERLEKLRRSRKIAQSS